MSGYNICRHALDNLHDRQKCHIYLEILVKNKYKKFTNLELNVIKMLSNSMDNKIAHLARKLLI